MVNLAISLTGANGDTISLDNNLNYILAAGVRGFGIPTTEVRIAPSAGDGGYFRHSKRAVREIDLPITIIGTDRGDVEAKLRRLAALLNVKNGATTVNATYSDGTAYALSAYYRGGAETVFGDTAGSTFCQWMITMQAPNPFWLSATPVSFVVGSGSTGRGLLPKLTKMRVSSDQTLGVVTANNTGDVDAFPIWQIRGPITNLVISNGTQSFSYPGTIAGGATVTVNTEAGTVTDDAGNNLYASLGTAPKLFALTPGTSSISVTGTAYTASTSVTCSYYPRYEVVH